MAEGTVVVRAFTSRAMIPIEGATVSFTQYTPTGNTRLLAVRYTDESGKTAPLTIATPELEESQEPQEAQPFTQVNIGITHPAYESILVERVQIFPGIQTVQNFELVPLEKFPESWSEIEVFDQPAQNL